MLTLSVYENYRHSSVYIVQYVGLWLGSIKQGFELFCARTLGYRLQECSHVWELIFGNSGPKH